MNITLLTAATATNGAPTLVSEGVSLSGAGIMGDRGQIYIYSTAGSVTMTVNIQLRPAVTAANGYAIGTITTVAKANLVDGETFTLNDGVTVYVFELDVAGDGVTGGRTAVDVSLDTTADQVRDRIVTAINSTAILITAASGGAATVSLTNDRFGSVGNATSAETVAEARIVLTDMAGGVAGVRLRDTTAVVDIV